LTTTFVAGLLKTRDRVVPLTPGDSHEYGGVRVHAERCEHAANAPLTFVVKTRRFSIYYPVDSDYFPEMVSIRDRYAPDVIIYTRSDGKTLKAISNTVKPRVIFCCEYPMMGPLTIPGIEVIQAKPLEWVVYPG
jgi:hypothetical protein